MDLPTENDLNQNKWVECNMHVCLQCKSCIEGLDQYMSHIKNDDCSTTEPEDEYNQLEVTSLAQKIKQEERINRQAQHDRPVHVLRGDTVQTWSSGFENYDGWIVYAIIVFTIGGTRVLLENAMRYGVQVSPSQILQFVFSQGENELFYRTPLFFLVWNFNFLFVYYLEHELANGKISSSQGKLIHIVHLFLVAFIPAATILSFPNMFSILGRIAICLYTWVIYFKIWSYVQVNKWCRKALYIQKNNKIERSDSFKRLSDESDEEEVPIDQSIVQYPSNLTLSDLCYFINAPTLCYQLNYPRSQGIRIGFILKHLFEVFVLVNIWLAMVQQWVIPTVKGSYKPFMESDLMWCIERILKLAIPFHCMWLIFFYLFFHSWLNVLAEILRFGDRKFYEDWWNARDLGIFWKTWNLPFHNWAKRHMYIPMIKKKMNKSGAGAIIFVLSAIMHEYCVSVPMLLNGTLTFSVFIAMIPLVPISEKIADKYGFCIGNTIMWLSQVLGLSMGLLVYYHDYLIKNISVNEI